MVGDWERDHWWVTGRERERPCVVGDREREPVVGEREREREREGYSKGVSYLSLIRLF